MTKIITLNQDTKTQSTEVDIMVDKIIFMVDADQEDYEGSKVKTIVTVLGDVSRVEAFETREQIRNLIQNRA